MGKTRSAPKPQYTDDEVKGWVFVATNGGMAYPLDLVVQAIGRARATKLCDSGEWRMYLSPQNTYWVTDATLSQPDYLDMFKEIERGADAR